MNQLQETDGKAQILVLGSTGRIGSKVIAELERINTVEVVRSSRKLAHVEAWRHEGKNAVLLDLDQPETFPEALSGIDHVFLATGYTVAMVHQSKTIVDAAADAGIKFIVHLGAFGSGRLTYAFGAWHEMVERYIEGSGVAWTHLHPHFFMDNLLAGAPVVGGKFHWFMGNKPVHWSAPGDLAAVAAKVLSDGPEHHGGKQYWPSAEILNGTQAAAEISKGLGIPVECVLLTPNNLVANVTTGAIKLPSFVEPTYGASILDWVRQTYDGRLDFEGVTTSVEDLTGRAAQTLENWVRANREAVLSAAS